MHHVKSKMKLHSVILKTAAVFLSTGFMYRPRSQSTTVACVMPNEAMKPSILRRHLNTKCKEYATKSINFQKQAVGTLGKKQNGKNAETDLTMKMQ